MISYLQDSGTKAVPEKIRVADCSGVLTCSPLTHCLRRQCLPSSQSDSTLYSSERMAIDFTLNIDVRTEATSELGTLYTKAAESLAWHAPENV